jgi:hypothetical protein
MATNDELRMYMERLEDRIKELENRKEPDKILNTQQTQQFEDIKIYPLLKIDNLILKHISQGTEPVILKNQVVLWTDTDDNKTYIVANFNGTTNAIELV